MKKTTLILALLIAVFAMKPVQAEKGCATQNDDTSWENMESFLQCIVDNSTNDAEWWVANNELENMQYYDSVAQ
jgi:type III secretory pathway component EscR